MKQRRSALGILVAFAVCPLTTGCELIAQVDRSILYEDPAVSSSSSSSSSSSGEAGAGGMGGAGGMAGAGGMGGTGGSGGSVVACDSNNACDDLNPCTTEVCEKEFCVYTPLDGVPTPNAVDTPGDCNKPFCVGGIDTPLPDDQDVPNDGIECTIEECLNGVLSLTNVAAGEPCGANMTLVCNGQGVCVGCNAPTDCAGQDSICQTRTCIGGTCGVQNAPAGTFVDGNGMGDCRQTECNGVGGLTTGPDDADLPPDDGNACTGETCSGGMAYHPFLNAGTACNQNGGNFCNGGGACVECLVASTCPGQDSVCQTRTCLANKCGISYVPSGTAIMGQTAGDCQTIICDGSGATATINDNMDPPADDGSACTAEVCNNGMPSHPNVPESTPCAQNGGTFCHDGACVQCVTSTDCPGIDTECAVRNCNAGLCSVLLTDFGTPLQNQIPGNCHEEQCDGVGDVMWIVDDTDVLFDALECTEDLCMAGTPANPPLTSGTVCNQNGGTICNGSGMCVVTADVVSVLPADGQTDTALDAPIRITFSTSMNPATLTGQTAHGPCIGSVQFSNDDFASCLAFANSSPSMNAGQDVATFTPAAHFSYLSTYKVRVTTAARSTGDVPLTAPFHQNTGFLTKAPPTPCGGSVVISQIYSSGGDTGALLRKDFVELHNRGNMPVSVAGWSLQYAYSFGTFNSVPNHTTPLVGTIPAGGYYLIQLSGDVFGSVDLPTPDAIGATDFESALGKVALVNTTTPLTGGCPTSSSIVDFVGYGLFANCFEGSGPAPTPPASTAALLRSDDGCIDTNDNTIDFTSLTASPRNTSAPANVCICGGNVTANETGRPDELDYCNIQFPLSISVAAGESTPLIFGRVYEAGITNPGGSDPSIVAEVGYGPGNINPSAQSGFTYVPMTFNMQYGNDDEYQGSFMAPAMPGSYRYVVRFSLDGVSWTYCDSNGAGSNPDLTFEINNLPVLDVTP